MFFQMCFNLSKLSQQLVVLQYFKVFHMEVGFIIPFNFLLRLTWINSFQDAETTEVLKRNLHVSDRVCSCFELGSGASSSFFDSFTHFYLIILILAAQSVHL